MRSPRLRCNGEVEREGHTLRREHQEQLSTGGRKRSAFDGLREDLLPITRHTKHTHLHRLGIRVSSQMNGRTLMACISGGVEVGDSGSSWDMTRHGLVLNFPCRQSAFRYLKTEGNVDVFYGIFSFLIYYYPRSLSFFFSSCRTIFTTTIESLYNGCNS